MEAGSKDRPPILAPGNYVQWKSRIKRYIDTKPNHDRIDNDIYSTVNACPNACEMWKGIKRLKQGESINVQDLETNLYWEFRKFTSQDGESMESYYSRSQQAATRHRGKAIFNSPQPIYDQEPSMVAEDEEMENMLLCKQEEARIQLNAEQASWRDDTDDDELEDQELEAHYIGEIDQNDDDNDLAK
nr:hypothetical protein [Tanacetum cinerariifolium]